MAHQSRNWGGSFRTQGTAKNEYTNTFQARRPFSFDSDRLEFQRDNVTRKRESLPRHENVTRNVISSQQRGSTASEQTTGRQTFSFGGPSQGMPALSYDLDAQSRMTEHLKRELEYLNQAKREHEFLKIANTSAKADRCSQYERQFLDRALHERELRERIKPPETPPSSLPITSGPVAHVKHWNMQPRRASEGHDAEVDHRPLCSGPVLPVIHSNMQPRRAAEGRDAAVDHRPALPVIHSNMQPRRDAEGRDAEVGHLLNRITEMTRLLHTNRVPPLNLRARSPSPPPHFNDAGNRTNTRKQRARNKLEQERHILIQRLLKITSDYVPPKNYVPSSFVKSVPLPVEEYPEIKFRDLITGPGDRVICEMERETGTKMRLKNSNDSAGGDIIKKPVYVEITAPSPDALTAGENAIKENIEMILQNHKPYVNERNKLILDAENKGCKVVRLLGINPEISSEDVRNLSDHIRVAEISQPNQRSPMHAARVVFGATSHLKETLSTLHDSRLWGPQQSIGVIMFAYDKEKKGLVQSTIESIIPHFSKLNLKCTEVTDTTRGEGNRNLSPGDEGRPAKQHRGERDNDEPNPKRQRISNHQTFPTEPFIVASHELAEESFQRHKSLTQRILKVRLAGGTTEEQVRELAPDVQHMYPKNSFSLTSNRKPFVVQLVFATPEAAEKNLVTLREKALLRTPLKVFRFWDCSEERWAKLHEIHLSCCNGLCLLVRDVYDPLPVKDYENCFPEAKSVTLIRQCTAVLLFDDVETAAKVFRDGINRELPGGRKFTLVFKLMGQVENKEDESSD